MLMFYEWHSNISRSNQDMNVKRNLQGRHSNTHTHTQRNQLIGTYCFMFHSVKLIATCYADYHLQVCVCVCAHNLGIGNALCHHHDDDEQAANER